MKIDKTIEEIFARIQKYQLHIECVHAAFNALGRSIDRGNIIEKLYEAQSREWQSLFMFGLVVDEKIKDRIKAAAYESFLNDHIHVAQYFSQNSSSWFSSDEDEFRKMCRTLFAPENMRKEIEEVVALAKGFKDAKKVESDVLNSIGIATPEKTKNTKNTNRPRILDDKKFVGNCRDLLPKKSRKK
jgi:hypothetical protein